MASSEVLPHTPQAEDVKKLRWRRWWIAGPARFRSTLITFPTRGSSSGPA